MIQLKNKNIVLPDVGFRFAKILLLLSLILLPFLAYLDFKNGYLLPAAAKCIVLVICVLAYLLSRNLKHQQIVRIGAAASLLIMAMVGAVYKLDSFSSLLWVPVLPLLFIFLIGTKQGLLYSAMYFIVYSISYFLFEGMHNKLPVEFDVWLASFMAAGFVAIVTVLFQKETQKNEKQLMHAARYDFLTQVLNRHGFVPRIEDEVARVNRYGSRLSIIVIDIDDFKQVNDRYGHGVGDTLLVEFAALIAQQTRSNDLVARWGGEEFIILAPNTGGDACADLAEKLRSCVEKKAFSSIGNITASFGVAQYRSGETWSEFLNRGDAFLFKAKQSGKNRVAAEVVVNVNTGNPSSIVTV